MKWTPIVAIICIAGLLAFAMANEINGALLASGCTIIGGLGGYGVMVLQQKRKGGK